MNRRKFFKSLIALLAMPFLPRSVPAVKAPDHFPGIAEGLRDVYMETGKERPLEYPTLAPSDESVANILNSGFKGHYIKEERK